MSLFLALFQCQNRQSSIERWLVFQKRLWVMMPFLRGTVLGLMVRYPGFPKRIHAVPALPQVLQAFHLPPPRNGFGAGTCSRSPLPLAFGTLPSVAHQPCSASSVSQLLFSAWNALSLWICMTASFSSMKDQLKCNLRVLIMTTSDKGPMPLTPAPLIAFQTLICGLLTCLSSVTFALTRI